MDQLAPLPVVLPLAAAALLTALHRRLPRAVADGIVIATCVLVIGLAGYLSAVAAAQGPIVTWFGGWRPRDGLALGIGFAIDAFGAGFVVLIATLIVVVFIFARMYMPALGALFHVLMLTFLGATAGYCTTGDLFNLYVFFELISVTAFALTAYRLEEASLHGALNLAVTNTLGGFLILAGIGLLYGHAGAINMADLGRILAGAGGDRVVATAFVLLLGGFLIKAAAAPFHFWLADAYAVAAMPVCVLFGGASVTLGVFGAARVYWTVFADGGLPEASVAGLLLWLGLATALLGGVLALAERHIKRMLAFTTVSHVGVLLVGLALRSAEALAGAALYLVGHALVKAALFILAGVLFARFAEVDRERLRGHGGHLPATGLIFALGGLILAGLPPGATYTGKSVLTAAADGAGLDWAMTVLVVASVLSGAADLHAAGAIFLGTPTSDARARKPQHATAGMTALAVVLIGISLTPGLAGEVEQAVLRGAVDFTDRDAYAMAVLDGLPRAPVVPPRPGPTPPTYESLLAALAAVALAAGLMLVRDRPGAIGRAAVIPAVRGLQGLHSGQVADYVAWLMLGMAMLGGTMAIAAAAS